MNELALILEGRKSMPETKGETKGAKHFKCPAPFVFSQSNDAYLFTSVLARLLEGGIPLLRSLEILAKEARSNRLQKDLVQIQEGIRQGRSLSEALPGKFFPLHLLQMIRAGEASGNIPAVLESIAGHLKKEQESKNKIRQALAYPCFILIMGFATVAVLSQIVLPKIALVYENFDGILPAPTRFILGLSAWFGPASVMVSLLIFVFVILLRKRPSLLLIILLKIPFAAGLLQGQFLSQFSKTLAMLLQGGIPLLEALELTRQTLPSALLQDEFSRVRDSLSQGKGFADSLRHVSWWRETSLALILSGEESGRLAEALRQISNDAESEIESGTHFLMKLLEPTLILAVGLVISFIVISSLLPILEMSELMS